MKVALASIRFDGQTQMRAEINGDAVAEYRDAMKKGATFPPVKLFFDGCDYWIGDGYHRWHAAGDAGFTEIEADVAQGTRRDAILWACFANATNGVRRTNVDKRKAVETLLKDDEWGQWSDRVIADKCGVSQPFVGAIRKQLITIISCENGHIARKSADGKLRRPAEKKQQAQREDVKAAQHKANLPAKLDTQAKGECIAGGPHEWKMDGDGAEYCGKCCEDKPGSKPDKAAKPESGIIAKVRPIWDAASKSERIALKAWINEQS